MSIPFNIPLVTGNEDKYIQSALKSKNLSGGNYFDSLCSNFLKERYGFKEAFITPSCTDALEFASIILGIDKGDEVIMPSYTFVSTANPFVLRGANVVFADSEEQTPNIDVSTIESLITKKTKVIVPVHYGGIACNMEGINSLSKEYNIHVVEDAAQCINSYYNNIPLGSIGTMGCFSFHCTKNITCGEGGLLAINNEELIPDAEIVREKGTNRSQLMRGEIQKYEWINKGSSFLVSELNTAFLYGQLEQLDKIQKRRVEIWKRYYRNLETIISKEMLPFVPDYATINGHNFYLRCNDESSRDKLINHLNGAGIKAVFHYLALHKSKFYDKYHDGRVLPNADSWTTNLIRLPLYYNLTNAEIDYICDKIIIFFR